MGNKKYKDKLSCYGNIIRGDQDTSEDQIASAVTPEWANLLVDRFNQGCDRDLCLMPRELTAENGAKGLLIGEFAMKIPVTCPECKGDGEVDLSIDEVNCEICDDSGTIDQITYIDWTTIKGIYAKCVEDLEVKL